MTNKLQLKYSLLLAVFVIFPFVANYLAKDLSTYFLFLVTLIGFPFAANYWVQDLGKEMAIKLLKFSFPVFLVHHLAFHFGYSLKGDYIDYILFSLEYFWFCALVCISKSYDSNWVKTFRITGKIVMGLTVIIGLIGTLLFIPLCGEFECNDKFYFSQGRRNYEVRYYSAGILDDTRYFVETYCIYRFLPIERRIDKTSFMEFNELSLKGIKDSVDKKWIIFKDIHDSTLVHQVE